MIIEINSVSPNNARIKNNEFKTLLKQVFFLKQQDLETYGKTRYDKFDKIFHKQRNNPKPTTQTTSETKPTSTNAPSIRHSQHNRLLTSTNRYEPKEIKRNSRPIKPKTKQQK